ncbi:MAG: ABC transporter permease, partial [Acidobacteriota bacterium]
MMDALLQQTAMSLRLHYRNRMALLYSYLFPLIFLLAFYVLYRYERVVLIRHMGELLTVGILGGACFGLPTTLVSERERGVWRRYRLAPVPTAGLVSSTIAARYAILVTAGLLQIALAVLLGMPLPRHPIQLWIAFTCVSFAFIGLGLVMATMADNVPAVQALGQCIFLPMLIIGGVAVPLASLPDWAQHLSAFFPGRYAVQAIQASVNGAGLGTARFDLLALVVIGLAGCVAGGMLFRWDAQQRFSSRRGKVWVIVPLAAWVAVGAMAEARHRIGTPQVSRTTGAAAPVIPSPAPPSTADPTPVEAPPSAAAAADTPPTPPAGAGHAPTPATAPRASGKAATPAPATVSPLPPSARRGDAPATPSRGAAPAAAPPAGPSDR